MRCGEELTFQINLDSAAEMHRVLVDLQKIKNPSKEVQEMIDTLLYSLNNVDYYK